MMIFFLSIQIKITRIVFLYLLTKKGVSSPADFALKILSGANLLEKLPSRQCNQMKQLLDACRHCLSLFEPLQCFYPSIQHTVAPALLCHTDSKEFTKTLSFHDLNFIEVPVKDRYLPSGVVVVPQFGSSHPELPPALGAPAVGGGQGEVGQSYPWRGAARSLLAAAR